MVDPQWIQAGSQVLASLVRPPAAAPSESGGMVSTPTSQDFDFSGFTVATGGSRATGATNNKTQAGTGNNPPGTASSSGGLSPLLVAGLAAGLAFLSRD